MAIEKHIVLKRKFRIVLDTRDQELKKEYLAKLYQWQTACFRAANYIYTHLYLQDQIKELFYINEGIKVKLSDIKVDPDGILTCSREGSTYKVLKKFFKGEIPMSMLGPLSHQLTALYNSERRDYWDGQKSLPNFKRNIPIPIASQCVNFKAGENRNFKIKIFKVPFETFLGQDKTDRRETILRVMSGRYKIGTSHILIRQNKTYLVLSVYEEKDHWELETSIIAEASLSMECPIAVKINRTEHSIGTKEEFLYRRVAIQSARKRIQASTTAAKSGHGRSRKLKSLMRYNDYEKKYIEDRLHVYSRKLIELCIKNRAGVLILVNQEAKEEVAKEDEFLLRNWSYFGLKEKLKYKADKAGITLICE